MAYSSVLYERLREFLPPQQYPAKRMFGGVAFFYRGHILVGVFGDGMLVRIPPADGDQWLREAGIRPLAGAPNRMRGFIVVDESLLDSDDDIQLWINRALAFNQTLRDK